MNSSEIRHLQTYLEFHHAEILEDLKSNHETDSETNSTGNHQCGSATSLVKEFLLRSRQEIESALARIGDGTYGNCVACGREIGLQRLRVVPWAQFCVPCQESEERQQTENRFLDAGPVSIAQGPAR
jgi:RNA polymerase-binding transcription factor DksA